MQSRLGSSIDLRELFAERGPLFIALLAVVVGLCLLCVFALLLLRDGGVGLGGETEPTPFPSPVEATENDVVIVGISGSTAISLPLTIPASLQVGSETFAVRPEPVEADGTWEPEEGEATTALWVYGTLINYVIGLPDNNDNRELLEGLGSGDQIQLMMRDGTQYTFSVTRRENVPTSRTDVFAQSVPGITLILLQAGGDERLIVQGDYVVESFTGGAGGGAGNAAELGETAELDGIRLTVTNATSLFDRPEAPSGFVFYLVDFQVQNVGNDPVDLGNLHFVLNDELGNQYVRSAQAVTLGSFPPPGGVLMPGETRQASVGYQIPSGLSSPTLTWTIAREGGNEQLRVTIPFAGGFGEAAARAAITLQSAEVSVDGTSLTVLGQITNNAEQPLVVNESQVSLVSNGTVHLTLSTNPAFPWVVPPGQSLPFSLSFQRPAGAEAVLTILSQPFQLSGLR